MGRLIVTAAAMLALASCGPPHRAAPPFPQQPGSANNQEKTPCEIIDSSDWAAWVNAMPGPDARPVLIVTGKVATPTGGFRFAWRDMRVMESYPVQVAVDLEAIPPTVGATEAVVVHDLRGQWPISPPVGSVTIRCGARTLATISPVETAH